MSAYWLASLLFVGAKGASGAGAGDNPDALEDPTLIDVEYTDGRDAVLRWSSLGGCWIQGQHLDSRDGMVVWLPGAPIEPSWPKKRGWYGALREVGVSREVFRPDSTSRWAELEMFACACPAAGLPLDEWRTQLGSSDTSRFGRRLLVDYLVASAWLTRTGYSLTVADDVWLHLSRQCSRSRRKCEGFVDAMGKPNPPDHVDICTMTSR